MIPPTKKSKGSRESHRDLHKRCEYTNDYFHTIWGNDLMYPGDTSAPAREVCNCHCVYIEHVLGKDESIYDGKVVKANTSKSAETLTGKGLKYIMQTGGKEKQQVQTRPGNSKKRDFLAEEYYERIRKIDDIRQIAKASGLSEAKIRKIKKHVFLISICSTKDTKGSQGTTTWP